MAAEAADRRGVTCGSCRILVVVAAMAFELGHVLGFASPVGRAIPITSSPVAEPVEATTEDKAEAFPLSGNERNAVGQGASPPVRRSGDHLPTSSNGRRSMGGRSHAFRSIPPRVIAAGTVVQHLRGASLNVSVPGDGNDRNVQRRVRHTVGWKKSSRLDLLRSLAS